MNHDRIHAREPTQDADAWQIGTIRELGMRDGHAVFTVVPERDDAHAEAGTIELVVTTAVRDLVLRRLPGDGDDESPLGQRVWYTRRGR
jgi:hypothetical protein